jgi:hypothetical protein
MYHSKNAIVMPRISNEKERKKIDNILNKHSFKI